MKRYFGLVVLVIVLVRRIFVPLCSKLLIQMGLGVVFILCVDIRAGGRAFWMQEVWPFAYYES